jgi:hypothetical protein
MMFDWFIGGSVILLAISNLLGLSTIQRILDRLDRLESRN